MQNQPHVASWYAASANLQLDFPPLLGETTADVCVIGGGESYSRRFPPDIKNFVRKYMLRIYPDLPGTRIDYDWGDTLLRWPGQVAGMLFYSDWVERAPLRAVMLDQKSTTESDVPAIRC